MLELLGGSLAGFIVDRIQPISKCRAVTGRLYCNGLPFSRGRFNILIDPAALSRFTRTATPTSPFNPTLRSPYFNINQPTQVFEVDGLARIHFNSVRRTRRSCPLHFATKCGLDLRQTPAEERPKASAECAKKLQQNPNGLDLQQAIAEVHHRYT